MTEAGRETISGRENRCWCGRPPALSAVVVAQPPTGTERHWCPEHGWSSRPLWAATAGEPVELDEDAWVRWADLATATRATAVVAALLPVPVLVVDPLVRAVWSNPSWTEATGLTREATRGAGWRAALQLDGPITLTEAVLEGDDQRVRLHSGPGHGRDVVLSCVPLVDADGGRLGHLVSFTNPPGRTDALDALVDPDAAGDAVSAHRLLVGRAEDALARSHVGQHDGTVAMLLVQVELAERPESKELLPVTDPDALQSLEDEIRARCDHGEAVVDEGGGVFAVVADGIASYGRAMDLANELARGLGRSARGRERKGAVRVSAGLAFAHLPDETAERLVANAAQALELARATGGGHVEVVIGTGPGSSDAWDPS